MLLIRWEQGGHTGVKVENNVFNLMIWVYSDFGRTPKLERQGYENDE